MRESVCESVRDSFRPRILSGFFDVSGCKIIRIIGD